MSRSRREVSDLLFGKQLVDLSGLAGIYPELVFDDGETLLGLGYRQFQRFELARFLEREFFRGRALWKAFLQ